MKEISYTDRSVQFSTDSQTHFLLTNRKGFGWRLQSAKGEAAFDEYKGAAQQLAAFMGETSADKIADITVSELEEAVVARAEDGTTATNYEIDFEGKSADEIKVITDYLKYIEYLSKWDGKLPSVMTEGSANIMIPTDSVENN